MSRNNAVILAAATFFMLIVSIITICRAVSLSNHPGTNNGIVMTGSAKTSNQAIVNALKKSDTPTAKELAEHLEAQEQAKHLANTKAFVLVVNFILAIFFIVVIAQNDEVSGLRKAFWIVAILIGSIFIMALYSVLFLGPVIFGQEQDKDKQASPEISA